MQQITVRLDEDTIESLEDEANERGESRSEYLRDVIASRHEVDELRTEVENMRGEHEQEVKQLQAKVDDLQRQLMSANQRIDDVNELKEYIESEKSLSERKAKAGVLTRAKWWFTGMD